MTRSGHDEDYFICPNCGAEVRSGKSFCRECGASDESGWNEEFEEFGNDSPTNQSEYDGFDYDEFIENEFPERTERARTWKQWLIVTIIIILCYILLQY